MDGEILKCPAEPLRHCSKYPLTAITGHLPYTRHFPEAEGDRINETDYKYFYSMQKQDREYRTWIKCLSLNPGSSSPQLCNLGTIFLIYKVGAGRLAPGAEGAEGGLVRSCLRLCAAQFGSERKLDVALVLRVVTQATRTSGGVWSCGDLSSAAIPVYTCVPGPLG